MNADESKRIIEHDDYFEIAGTGWHEEYENIAAPEKLLACIYHLSEKAYFTSTILRDLMDVWQRHCGYCIDGSYVYKP